MAVPLLFLTVKVTVPSLTVVRLVVSISWAERGTVCADGLKVLDTVFAVVLTLPVFTSLTPPVVDCVESVAATVCNGLAAVPMPVVADRFTLTALIVPAV